MDATSAWPIMDAGERLAEKLAKLIPIAYWSWSLGGDGEIIGSYRAVDGKVIMKPWEMDSVLGSLDGCPHTAVNLIHACEEPLSRQTTPFRRLLRAAILGHLGLREGEAIM